MRTWLFVVGLVGCASSSSVECDFGLTCPEGTLCDEVHTGCIVQQQLDVCVGQVERAGCATDEIGEGVCDRGVCLGPNCGDGVRTPAEICDGDEIAADAACSEFGFYGGSLACSATCTLDPAPCTGRCGDGEINGPEICDSTLPTATCLDLGFGAGPLACSNTCGPDTSSCIPFGWRAIDFPHDVAVVHGTSATNIWVAGKSGMVQRFDGVTWSVVDINACTNSNLSELFVLSETDAIVADSGGVIRISATGCAYDSVAINIDALWAASPMDMYAGSVNGLWHYTGTSWQPVDAQPSRQIWGRSGTDIYRGDELLVDDVQHYDGVSWTDANVPTIGTVYGIWGNAQEVFVSGICASDEACVMRNRGGVWNNWLFGRGGFTVTAQAGNGAGDSNQTFVVAYDYASAPIGTVLATDGLPIAGWANIEAPYFGLEATPFWTGSALYLSVRESNRVFVFDGTAHVDTLPPPSGIAELAVVHADDVVVAANGSAWRWDGATWSSETAGVTHVSRAASGTVLALGPSGVRERSSPGAYSIAKSFPGNLVAGQSFDDFFVVQSSMTSILHYKTGATPASTTATLAQGVLDIVSITPSFAIAVGQNGFIAHWNGTSWAPQTLTPGVTFPFIQVTAHSATDAHAITNNALLRWDGTSWTPLPLPTADLLYDVNGKAGDLFLATGSGLFHHDGMRWSPVDIGDLAPVERLASRGNTLLWVEPGSVDQLVRTVTW